MIIFALLAVIIVVILYAKNKSRFENKSPWQHFFDGLELSTQEFYTKVEAAIRDRKVNVDFAKESFLQSHIFSARREYLRISKGEYVFFICAAPFGTGTFISQWLCVTKEDMLNRIPVLNKLAGKDREDKSFYQVDTEAMYRMLIHSALLSVIDEITNAKGVRGLTDIQRIYQPSEN